MGTDWKISHKNHRGAKVTNQHPETSIEHRASSIQHRASSIQKLTLAKSGMVAKTRRIRNWELIAFGQNFGIAKQLMPVMRLASFHVGDTHLGEEILFRLTANRFFHLALYWIINPNS